MKSPPLSLMEQIEKLKESIITFGMAKLRFSNIEKQKKLEELLKKIKDNEKV